MSSSQDRSLIRRRGRNLTLGAVVHLESTIRESLSTEKKLAIKRLYEASFNPVCIFGGNPFQSNPSFGKEMLVYIAKLYRAPPGEILYRLIHEKRVEALLARKRLMSSF
jgi:hypothetical protein